MVDIMVLLYLLDQNHTYIPMDGQTRQPEVETPTPEIMPQPIKEYDWLCNLAFGLFQMCFSSQLGKIWTNRTEIFPGLNAYI